MKIKVEVTLDIDPEAWCSEYGVDPSEIRADVKKYSAHVLYETYSQNGVLN